MVSLKGNIILNALNTITGIIFPVITFPYAARVLMPEGIGAVNFLNSIVNYLILLTSLGIPMYAVREIAKAKNDRRTRDMIATEILILSSILCILGYIGVWILATFVPQIKEQAPLFFILSLSILFTALGANWFYQGIEDFKFITIRAIIIRSLSAAALFIFVKNQSDILIYGIITVGSTVGNNIINFFHLRKHLYISDLSPKELRLLRHIKPMLQIFLLNIISSLYLNLNSVMLGFMTGDAQVGYFAAGTKISNIVITLIASATTVMIPRASNLIQEGQKEKFSSLINKMIDLTCFFAYPLTIGLMVLAVPATLVFCGNEYSESIPVLLFNSPLILIISFTGIMAHQTLYPMGKVKLVIYSVAAGALANIICNIFLIPLFGSTGTAIATLVTETAVFVSLIAWGKKLYPFSTLQFFQPKYFIASVLMGVVVYTTLSLPIENWLKLCIGTFTGSLVYITGLYLFKDQTLSFLANFRNKIEWKKY